MALLLLLSAVLPFTAIALPTIRDDQEKRVRPPVLALALLNLMARAHETQAAGEPAGVTGVRQAADEVRRAQHLERGEFKSVGAAERFARGQEPHPPRRKATLVGQARRLWERMDKTYSFWWRGSSAGLTYRMDQGPTP